MKNHKPKSSKQISQIHPRAYFKDKIVPIGDANLSVASSAVLYGLSVYTVFPVVRIGNKIKAFCLEGHFERLINSAKIIGIDTFENTWNYKNFKNAVAELVFANCINSKVFIRATVHVSELVPGTRSRGLETTLSLFVYDAKPIIPQTGARLKTSFWRRIPDCVIPSRAKVNGAYVNSVLGKQDAIDSGYDDCLFLDTQGHVCELSAANIFMVRDGVLITPDPSSDILEGVNRKVILELARELNIPISERAIDLTELYVADEVFACGTSAFIAPIIEIDSRKIRHMKSADKLHSITNQIREKYEAIFRGESGDSYFTTFG